MKISTKVLSGEALNFVVCKAEGHTAKLTSYGVTCYQHESNGLWVFPEYLIWADAGPIIERECINLCCLGAGSEVPKNPDCWEARIFDHDELICRFGASALEAAMRCFVAYKLGDEVKIPKELK